MEKRNFKGTGNKTFTKKKKKKANPTSSGGRASRARKEENLARKKKKISRKSREGEGIYFRITRREKTSYPKCS